MAIINCYLALSYEILSHPAASQSIRPKAQLRDPRFNTIIRSKAQKMFWSSVLKVCTSDK